MKIVVDAFGGDNAPLEIIKGAALAHKEYGVDIILTGDTKAIEKCMTDNGISSEGITIEHAPDVISMHDEPTSILKQKNNSSMAVAFKVLTENRADAFVSAGSTGAIVVGGTLIVKRIKGIKRPALASMIPSKDNPFLMLDIGANADCRPEMLAQFGVMAHAYLTGVEGVENPKIALLNIGTEDTKGDELRKQTYELLSKKPINFVGNIESRELCSGTVDAVVADGFTGNIALKLIEGVASTMFSLLKRVFYKNIITKISTLALKKGLYSIKSKMDYTEVGGALLLGVQKPVIKAHGSSNAKAIKNAIHQAMTFAERGIVSQISDLIKGEDNE